MTAYQHDIEKELALAAGVLPGEGRLHLIHGDFREVGAQIPDESVDFIITDPPYAEAHLPLYADLAQLAARVLKPGGSLLVMHGQRYLPQVLQAMAGHLTYFWQISYATPGGQAVQIWDRKVISYWKPISWFVKGAYTREDWHGDAITSAPNDNDKRFHEWGQSESGFTELLEKFVEPGSHVLDPMVGGGTTLVVAYRLGLRGTGIDLEMRNIETTKRRLIEAAGR